MTTETLRDLIIGRNLYYEEIDYINDNESGLYEPEDEDIEYDNI